MKYQHIAVQEQISLMHHDPHHPPDEIGKKWIDSGWEVVHVKVIGCERPDGGLNGFPTAVMVLRRPNP